MTFLVCLPRSRALSATLIGRHRCDARYGADSVVVCDAGGLALHLPVHWAQCLLWRGYVPGALTTVPAALYCVWAFVSCAGSLSPALSVALAVAGLAVMAVNLWLIHKLMPRLWRLTGGDGE